MFANLATVVLEVKEQTMLKPIKSSEEEIRYVFDDNLKIIFVKSSLKPVVGAH